MSFFGAKAALEPNIPAEMVVDLVDGGILRIRFFGYVDGPLIERGTQRVRELLSKRNARVFLADTLGITGVDASMRPPGLDFISVLKGHGISAGYISVSSPVVRLLASTLGMASGFRLELLATTELATRKAQSALRSGKD
jgi:hypothetical protein